MRDKLKAFTIVELLIVVVIISVLSAIAVPNFLAAQIRSKASRVMADHRTLATALEAYYIDYGTYPPNNNGVSGMDPTTNARTEFILTVLSTPNSYIAASLLTDPFENAGAPRIVGDPGLLADYGYFNTSSSDILGTSIVAVALGFGEASGNFKANRWWLFSAGPDASSRVAQIATGLSADPFIPPPSAYVAWVVETAADPIIYDPSNGTISRGDILRTGKGIFKPSHVGL